MHVKNKAGKTAVLGVLAALSLVFMILGTVISVNTIFFTSAAAFLAGIAVTLYGSGSGFLFYAVCGALDFLLNPNKLHVILYLVLAGYILICEIVWAGMKKMQDGRKKEWIHRVIRFGLFAALYIPVVCYAPELFLSVKWMDKPWFLRAAIPFGIVAWAVFDLAYIACKKLVGNQFGKLKQEE